MAFDASRLTLSTTMTKVAENTAALANEAASVRADFVPQVTTGTILVGGASDTTSTALRWDVSVLAAKDWVIEPGEALYMAVTSGTMAVDMLVSGR